MRLTIVRGLPGSGKSTFAKSLNVFHVEMDMFCMIDGRYKFDKNKIQERANQCLEAVRCALSCGIDVVVSNTFSRFWEMEEYIELAHTYSAELQVWCMTENFGNVHNVPEETIQNMKDRWESYPGEVKRYKNWY